MHRKPLAMLTHVSSIPFLLFGSSFRFLPSFSSLLSSLSSSFCLNLPNLQLKAEREKEKEYTMLESKELMLCWGDLGHLRPGF